MPVTSLSFYAALGHCIDVDNISLVPVGKLKRSVWDERREDGRYDLAIRRAKDPFGLSQFQRCRRGFGPSVWPVSCASRARTHTLHLLKAMAQRAIRTSGLFMSGRSPWMNLTRFVRRSVGFGQWITAMRMRSRLVPKVSAERWLKWTKRRGTRPL